MLFENICKTDGCDRKDQVFEWYCSNRSIPDPLCESCGQQTKRCVSRFNAPWTGTLDRFDDPNIESKNDKDGGHIAYKVRSSRLLDKEGKSTPEPVLIRTRQDQVRFCREEGLVDPAELNPRMQASDDGMQRTQDLMGVPGVWN